MRRITLTRESREWAAAMRLLDLTCDDKSSWPFMREDGMSRGETRVRSEIARGGDRNNPQLMRRSSLEFRGAVAIEIQEIRNGRAGVSFHKIYLDISPGLGDATPTKLIEHFTSDATEKLSMIRLAESRRASIEVSEMSDMLSGRKRSGSSSSSGGGGGRSGGGPASSAPRIEAEAGDPAFDLGVTPRLTRE